MTIGARLVKCTTKSKTGADLRLVVEELVGFVDTGCSRSILRDNVRTRDYLAKVSD